MIKEFHIALKKSILLSTFLKLSTSRFPGVSVGGIVLYAELGLVAITNIQ
ncbi:Uncharacterised protein [Mycobacteroides abscessus subsp. abscessus]|nr:Uncharacterised protein [Mycobacteroides abscessus subsp. abscessus]